MKYEELLDHKAKDFKGRSLEEIWNFSDLAIGSIHDFVQIIFPSNQPSQSIFHGHYLNGDKLVQKLKNNIHVEGHIICPSRRRNGRSQKND